MPGWCDAFSLLTWANDVNLLISPFGGAGVVCLKKPPQNPEHHFMACERNLPDIFLFEDNEIRVGWFHTKVEYVVLCMYAHAWIGSSAQTWTQDTF